MDLIYCRNLDSDNCCNQCKYAIPIKGKPVESLNNSTNKRKRYFQFIDFQMCPNRQKIDKMSGF